MVNLMVLFILIFFYLAVSMALIAIGVLGLIRNELHIVNVLLLILLGGSIVIFLITFLLNVSGFFGPSM